MSGALNDHEWIRVDAGESRVLEVLLAGARGGLPVVYHSGTPTAATEWPPLHEAALQRNLRLVTYSRPGYAESSPRPGRRVADATEDVTAILDRIGGREFVTFGWSGGGPHALACAALMPDRCLAAATVASIAPYPADGLDWFAGMGHENVDEFSLALDGADALTPFLVSMAEQMATLEPRDVADALGALVSDVDRAALTDEFATLTAETFRRAVSRGIEGWLEDDLAFTHAWGFELAGIRPPVAVWQGAHDMMVPFTHGEWLAAHIAGAEAHLLPDEGHLSLGFTRVPAVLDELLRLAAGGT